MLLRGIVLVTLIWHVTVDGIATPNMVVRQCEPIRIEMCRGIGYNETSMPNLVGHEMQTEVEFTLQTFAPLIDYVCSTQLKLFLCTAYVPMCTPKVPLPIGPCRNLCESVRSRCHPVLQGFGFPWPPALDCARFPMENNHETMCMEGPGESYSSAHDNEMYPAIPTPKVYTQGAALECPGTSKSYVKLHRSGRCAPVCEADILFGRQEKHLAELWVATWTYAVLVFGTVATLWLVLSGDSKRDSKCLLILTPLVWCHDMTVLGWTVRFVSGRIATSCGYDPQLPNVSLLLVDGLSNASCAATFLLRYYFGMAACAWWAILCLGWHRNMRRDIQDGHGNITIGLSYGVPNKPNKCTVSNQIYSITHSNVACFVAWGLPAFQTAAVIVARLVDADELLGSCFVGNQSDKGLQVLVATPLFCYWIFGCMNLISGYLVYRRKKEIMETFNSPSSAHRLQPENASYGLGNFLLIYCVPLTVLLLAVIYEFANIDIWLNASESDEEISTPLWPFLSRAFMELMLGIICFAWILGPKMSTMYKREFLSSPIKQTSSKIQPQLGSQNSRHTNSAYSTVSYQTVRQPVALPLPHPQKLSTIAISNLPSSRNKPTRSSNSHVIHYNKKRTNKCHHFGNETVL